MIYKVEVEKQAVKQLAKIASSDLPKIKAAIAALAENPRPAGCKKLKGYEAYRIRSGNYRIIYEVEDDIITVIVIDVGHRSSIYRDL